MLDTYQFGYFLRNTDPHAVLIKTRRFTAAPRVERPVNIPPPQSDSAPAAKKAGRKRTRKTTAEPKVKKASKGKGKAKQVQSDTEDEAEFSEREDDGPGSVQGTTVRRSTRRRRVAGSYAENDNDEGIADTAEAEVEMEAAALVNEGDPNLDSTAVANEDATMDEDLELPAPPPEDTLMVEEEEEKPKPVLQLRYQSFSVHGRCLCVIVEPYPPIRQQRQMSLAPTGVVAPRAPSIAPADFVPSGAAQRAKTPLFLPDDDDDDFSYRRSVTPAPAAQRSRPPVPLFNDNPDTVEEDGDGDNGGMLAFSQVLHTMGDHYTGAADDDDEMEGMVLFGDADEIRGL